MACGGAVHVQGSVRILKEKLEKLRDFSEEIRRSEASEANERTDRKGEARKRHRWETWFQAQA